MDANDLQRVALDDAMRDPTSTFRRPLDIVLYDGLAASEKRALLERWKLDAEQLAAAEDENMAGGEPAPLAEVLEALEALDAGPEKTVVVTPVASSDDGNPLPLGEHKVGGVYESFEAARDARRQLIASGVPAPRIIVLSPSDAARLHADGADAATAAAKDTSKAAGLGAGMGAIGVAALAAANVGVVLSAPVVALLAGLGVGGLAGTTVGAAASLSLREPAFLALLRDALENGCWAVVTAAQTEEEALEHQHLFSLTASIRTIDQGGGVAQGSGTDATAA